MDNDIVVFVVIHYTGDILVGSNPDVVGSIGLRCITGLVTGIVA
jgi:hypothetical protein